jgi:hypothetical protein
MSMKNSSDTIENRTRGVPVCSAVSQPTAPPRAIFMMLATINNNKTSICEHKTGVFYFNVLQLLKMIAYQMCPSVLRHTLKSFSYYKDV